VIYCVQLVWYQPFCACRLGNAVAVLSLDSEYQSARIEARQRETTATGLLKHSGKSLVGGVVDGLSGLVLQPLRGAQRDGAAGFFKGLGKGVFGLVTKPVVGVFDMTSSAIGAARAAAMNEQILARVRPARHVRVDGTLPAFTLFEAEGAAMLRLVDHELARAGTYMAHAFLTDEAAAKKKKKGKDSDGQAIGACVRRWRR
jgi:vacuolar protein sorting-associated protein 13A/C